MTTPEISAGERLAYLAIAYLKQRANYFDGWSMERTEAHQQALVATCAERGVSIQEALAIAAQQLAIDRPDVVSRLWEQEVADQRAAVRGAALERRERPVS